MTLDEIDMVDSILDRMEEGEKLTTGMVIHALKILLRNAKEVEERLSDLE